MRNKSRILERLVVVLFVALLAVSYFLGSFFFKKMGEIKRFRAAVEHCAAGNEISPVVGMDLKVSGIPIPETFDAAFQDLFTGDMFIKIPGSIFGETDRFAELPARVHGSSLGCASGYDVGLGNNSAMSFEEMLEARLRLPLKTTQVVLLEAVKDSDTDFSFTQVEDLVERYGEDGATLHTDGTANFFFVIEQEKLFIVSVARRAKDKWIVFLHPMDSSSVHPGSWSKVRVFFRN
jgi:hypothetical protein